MLIEFYFKRNCNKRYLHGFISHDYTTLQRNLVALLRTATGWLSVLVMHTRNCQDQLYLTFKYCSTRVSHTYLPPPTVFERHLGSGLSKIIDLFFF